MSQDQSNVDKIIEFAQQLVNIEVKDEATMTAADMVMADDNNVVTPGEAQDIGENLIKMYRSDELESMSERDKVKQMQEFGERKLKAVKAKKAIQKLLKNNGMDTQQMELEISEHIQDVVDGALDDADYKSMVGDIMDQMNEPVESPDGEATVAAPDERYKKVIKVLDPSAGKEKVKQAAQKMHHEVEIKVDDDKGQKSLSSQITGEVTSMADKEEYNNYNTRDVKDVDLMTTVNMFGGIKAPSDYEAYRGSPRRLDADDFINQTVREVRKIRKINLEEFETKRLVGKKINRNDLYRQDNKIFKRRSVPEPEPAELSVYVALDFSGSTSGGLDTQIASIGIALTEAFEKLKIKHTIMTYTGPVSIVKRGVKATPDKYLLASPDVRGCGGNNEYAVFKLISELVQEEKEKDVLVMIITDGDGSGVDTGIELLESVIDKDKSLDIHGIGLCYDGGSFTLERAVDEYGVDNAHAVKNKKEFGKTVGSIFNSAINKKPGGK